MIASAVKDDDDDDDAPPILLLLELDQHRSDIVENWTLVPADDILYHDYMITGSTVAHDFIIR